MAAKKKAKAKSAPKKKKLNPDATLAQVCEFYDVTPGWVGRRILNGDIEDHTEVGDFLSK